MSCTSSLGNLVSLLWRHLGFFHFIFVSHCLACSGWQKLSGKKTGPGTEENTRNTQKQARKTTGKTKKAEKGEAKMIPNCRETSKTVQLYLCEVSPNKYVWNPPYYRETKFILLKNIAKRRLPTPLRISGKVKKSVGGRGKVVRGIRGPQGPSRRKTVCFWNSVPEKRSTPVAKQKW